MEKAGFEKICSDASTIMETSRSLQKYYDEEISKLRDELRVKNEKIDEMTSQADSMHNELTEKYTRELQSLQDAVSSKDDDISCLKKSLENCTSVNKVLEAKVYALSSQLIELRKTLSEKDIIWPL
jgi:uncharacterized coiled-coil DUF342 family protein